MVLKMAICIGYRRFFKCLILVVIFASVTQVNADTIITKAEGSGDIVVKNGLKTLDVMSGETVALTCTVDGREDLVSSLWFGPSVGISFKGYLLHPERERFSVTVQRTADNLATEYTIRIQDVRPEDEGQYRCQGIQSLTEDIQIVILKAANITRINDLQFAQEGDEVNLWCIAEGHPQPQVQWRHVRPNSRLPNGLDGIYFEGINLDIPNITLEDRGEYECIASNGIPDNTSSVIKGTYIRMEYKPIVKAIGDNNTIDGNAVIEVPNGQRASLQCKSMAYPRVSATDVIWYLGDDELSEAGGYSWEVTYQLPTEQIDFYEETTFSVLQITVNSGVAGQYRCQFGNTIGTASAVIQLNVAGGSPLVTEVNGGVTTSTTVQLKVTNSTADQWKVDSETKTRPLGPIIGGVFAGIIIIIGIIIIVLVLLYRFKKRHEEKGTHYSKVDHSMEPNGEVNDTGDGL